MRYIIKNKPPENFVEYCKKDGVNFKDFRRGINQPLYNEVKESLCEEQGWICCYCGRRITGGADTSIEHLFPKGVDVYESMQLDYESNFLACCDGGIALRKENDIYQKKDTCCDKHKSDNIIPINPLMINCEEKFVYDENGEVYGIGKDAEVTISILNLNSAILVNLRQNAIRAYKDYIIKDKSFNAKEEIASLDKKIEGKYEEFCFVLKSYLQSYL